MVTKEEPVTFHCVARRTVFYSGMNMHVVAVLLRGMQKLKVDSPKDPRTLLRIPRHTRVQKAEGGKFAHFGLEESMQRVLANFPDLDDAGAVTRRWTFTFP